MEEWLLGLFFCDRSTLYFRILKAGTPGLPRRSQDSSVFLFCTGKDSAWHRDNPVVDRHLAL